MAPYSELGGDRAPVYDGIWTGLKILQVLSVRDEIYVIYENAAGLIKIAKLDESAAAGTDGSSKTKCRLYTGYKYFNKAFSLKQLKAIELRISKLQGAVNVRGYYRGDGYSLWSSLNSGTVQGGNGLEQRRRRLRMVPLHHAGVAPSSNDKLDRAYGFQICIEWEGKMQIDLINMMADIQTDAFEKLSDEIGTGIDLAEGTDQIELDDYDYEVAQ